MKNITVIDVALADLIEQGRTEAPPEVLQALEAKGHVTLSAGVPSLTDKGRRRAEKLSQYPDLRRGFGAAGGATAVRTDGGCTLHAPGGAVIIRGA